jgi:hypothetical protein
VKSTSDMLYSGMMTSDAKMIKNSKRSAQHQLRDHVELLQASTELGTCMTTKRGGSNFYLPLSFISLFCVKVEVYSLHQTRKYI